MRRPDEPSGRWVSVIVVRRVRGLARLVPLAVLVIVGGCASAPAPEPESNPSVVPSVTPAPAPKPPPVNGRFDYQLGGAYRPAASVTIVDRDRSEKPVRGTYSICYVNAFQTQPEEKRFWLDEHADLLLKRHGKRVVDPDWPGEYLLDTSTAAKRTAIAAVVSAWISGCATAGFQAVEPDNLDSWTRSKGLLTRADNVALATTLAGAAHTAGLAIAQKNTSELGTRGKTKVGFDFAVVEECERYRECGDYRKVYGKNMIEIEYTDNPRSAYTRACRLRGASISVILRDRDVLPRGERGYAYRSC